MESFRVKGRGWGVLFYSAFEGLYSTWVYKVMTF